MSEQFRPDPAEYALRLEYETSRSEALHEPAFEALEDLLNHRDGITSRTLEGGVACSRLSLFCVNNEATIIEVQAAIEDYRRGPLRRMARLSLREFIPGSVPPYVMEYQIEEYAGGGTQAQIETILRGRNADARPMMFYDFTDLLNHIEASAEMIQIMTEVENG
ncbi:MAG: hypothetical protein ACREGE_00935 [Candidatus Microsaccharimonas sp.]